MDLKLQASDDGQNVGLGVREALACDKLRGCATRSVYPPRGSPCHARTLSDSDLAVADLTLNDSSFDANKSILQHSGIKTPPRSHSYRIWSPKSVLSPRRDSTACVFQLPKPLTEEQTRAGYCILTFDEPLLHCKFICQTVICQITFRYFFFVAVSLRTNRISL